VLDVRHPAHRRALACAGTDAKPITYSLWSPQGHLPATASAAWRLLACPTDCTQCSRSVARSNGRWQSVGDGSGAMLQL